MKRRSFIQKSVAIPFIPTNFKDRSFVEEDELVIERSLPGRPHQGKILAAIQPHSDDIPLFAAGTVAKLIDEGYRGYLIQMTNDDHAGAGDTVGEVIRNNEVDTDNVAKALGLEKVYNLYYRNHRMDNISPVEIRARLVFLIRMLKIDTIVCYDPSGHYEENPDHYITASAWEAARWMAGGRLDYPEHFDAGLKPHTVSEMYYFARGPQLVNRVVDIGKYIDKKIEANLANVTQGPAGNQGARIYNQLKSEGKKLNLLGNSEEEANKNYIKNVVLDMDSKRLRGVPSDRELGKQFNLEWAEAFHYIGPKPNKFQEYLDQNVH
ncbi:MAG: PIG-L family deacetylase [Saprospiraceae bacterium]|nr:PIG-L family deacetylase [Saprospiraceae bacterium]